MPQVFIADAANEEVVRRTFLELNTKRLVRGTVYAATMLKANMLLTVRVLSESKLT